MRIILLICTLCLLLLKFCCVSVADDQNKLDANQEGESTARLEPTASCTELEKPHDTDCESNEFNIASSAKAVEEQSDGDGAKVVNVESVLDTNYQSLPEALNPSAQCATADETPSTGNFEPNLPEVCSKSKKHTSSNKKKFHTDKFNTETGCVSAEVAEVTWEISSCDDNFKKNVVLIRRQHPTAIPDSHLEVAACPVQESLSPYAMSCDTEERNISSEIGDIPAQQVDPVSQEYVDGAVKVKAVENTCTKADTPADTLAGNDVSFSSASCKDTSGNQNIICLLYTSDAADE